MALIYTQRPRLLQAPSAPLQPRCSRPPAPRCRSSDLGRSTLARVRPGRGALGTPRRAQGTTHSPTPLVQITDRANFFCLAEACLSRPRVRGASVQHNARTSQAQTHTVRAPAEGPLSITRMDGKVGTSATASRAQCPAYPLGIRPSGRDSTSARLSDGWVAEGKGGATPSVRLADWLTRANLSAPLTELIIDDANMQQIRRNSRRRLACLRFDSAQLCTARRATAINRYEDKHLTHALAAN